MDIKSRLQLIDSLHTGTSTFREHSAARETKTNVDQVFGGRYIENEQGSFFAIERPFPADHTHGIVQLGTLLDRTPAFLSVLAKDSEFTDVDLSKVLFLDTETTGLSGGVGTLAFLVGLGCFRGDEFLCIQYLINDFNEESAMLHSLNKLMEGFDLLVTYNGKSFDAPLLVSRNIFLSMSSPLFSIPHFDLLHAVRRMWKHKLSECSLGCAEQQLINVRRVGDIPSAMIPHIYFEYLRTRDAVPLIPILYHNQQDVLSMVALFSEGLRLLEHDCAANEPEQIAAIGKMYEGVGDYEKSIALYEHCLASASNPGFVRELAQRIAYIYKKLGAWSKARGYWQRCLIAPFHPLAYIELAKLLEHREKDYAEALSLVDRALEQMGILSALGRDAESQQYRDDLEHRKKRLNRKLKTAATQPS